MATKRIPLFGSLINRNADPNSFTGSDQRFVNCYPEVVKNPISGTGHVYLYKRYGTSAGGALTGVATTDQGAGAVLWTGGSGSPVALSFINTGSTSTSVWNENISKIGGDIANTSNCYALSETVISGVANLAGYFVDSGTGLIEAWFFPVGGAWTQITDGDFPPNLGTPEPLATGSGPVHMDGFMFVATQNGKVWNSDLNSLTAWTANSFITAQSSPDMLVGLARYKNLIVAFGATSTEFFQNTGNATGSPLTVVSGATLRIGCQPSQMPNGAVIYQAGDTVYWIGINPETGTRGVYRLNGYSAEKVSNADIDKQLNSNSSGRILGSFNSHGMSHILIFANDSFAFCIETGVWWIVSPGIGTSIKTIRGAISAGGTSYFNGSDAKVHAMSGSLYQDDGANITTIVQTENIDMGTMDRKFIERIRVVGDKQTSASAITVSYSDDDYGSFTTWGTIDMSDLAAINRGLTRGGATRRRSFKFTHTANTPLRLEAFDLTYVMGTS